MQGGFDRLLNFPSGNAWNLPRARRILFQAGQAKRQKSFPPQLYRRARHLQCPSDLACFVSRRATRMIRARSTCRKGKLLPRAQIISVALSSALKKMASALLLMMAQHRGNPIIYQPIYDALH